MVFVRGPRRTVQNREDFGLRHGASGYVHFRINYGPARRVECKGADVCDAQYERNRQNCATGSGSANDGRMRASRHLFQAWRPRTRGRRRGWTQPAGATLCSGVSLALHPGCNPGTRARGRPTGGSRLGSRQPSSCWRGQCVCAGTRQKCLPEAGRTPSRGLRVADERGMTRRTEGAPVGSGSPPREYIWRARRTLKGRRTENQKERQSLPPSSSTTRTRCGVFQKSVSV